MCLRPYPIKALTSGDIDLARGMNMLFASVFDMHDDYARKPPSDTYLRKALANDAVIAMVALDANAIVGAITAFELVKLEQERSEIYIYDLAVEAAYRRRGIATSLIRSIQAEAKKRGAWVVYVQADWHDEVPVRLYSKLGVREDVHHFDLPVR
ncbi:MAG: GNAT family N-acetyltransferase [Pseudomonadota bacterium]